MQILTLRKSLINKIWRIRYEVQNHVRALFCQDDSGRCALAVALLALRAGGGAGGGARGGLAGGGAAPGRRLARARRRARRAARAGAAAARCVRASCAAASQGQPQPIPTTFLSIYSFDRLVISSYTIVTIELLKMMACDHYYKHPSVAMKHPSVDATTKLLTI